MNTDAPGIVWLASYPKAGNTWARLALCSLREGGAQLGLGDIVWFGIMPTTRRLFEDVLEVEAGNLNDKEIERLRPMLHDVLASSLPQPRLLKIHDRWHRTPANRPVFDLKHTRKTIYIIRDPRDVAVSWARFSSKSIDWGIGNLRDSDSRLNRNSTKIATNITQWLGHWSTHVTSWVDESGLTPLVIRYEDMHADLPATLFRLAAYLDWPTSDEAIAGAVTATRFDRLADQERQHGFAEIPDTASKFFVSGRAGGWRDILTPEQAARVERDHETVMRRFGYL